MKGYVTIGFLIALLAAIGFTYVLFGSMQKAGGQFGDEALRAQLKARADLTAALVNLVYLQGGALSYSGDAPSGMSIEGCWVSYSVKGIVALSSCLAPNASASASIIVEGKKRWFDDVRA